MEKTNVSTLLWVCVIAVPIGWTVSLIIDSATYALPPVPWVLPALMVALAAVLEIARRAVRGWIEHRKFDQKLDPLRIARLLVLAKASAVFGAALAGAYVGLAVHAIDALDSPMGRNRLLMAGIVVAAGVAVIATALRCEAACRIPPPDDKSG